jgi:micrococcal nuclease
MLEGLEKAAREAKKGLWADPQPVPPWQWRKRSALKRVS